MHPIELLPVDAAFAALLDGAARPTEGGAAARRVSRLARRLRRQILTLPATGLPWGGFLAVGAGGREVVGSCGFRGPAGPERSIEIAYHTLPGHEGRGYATAMARALVEIAWGDPALRAVVARTVPRPCASTRVLGKLGMRRVGEGTDPVEGPVWWWRLDRPAPAFAGEVPPVRETSGGPASPAPPRGWRTPRPGGA